MKSNRIIMNVIISSIMGIALCLIIKALSSVDDIQSNTIFIAELDKNIFPGQRITAETLIGDLPNVRSNTLTLITAAQALANMKEDMPELEYMADNPFHDVITFKTKGINRGNLEDFQTQIKEISGVSEVFYDDALINTLVHSTKKARMGLLVIASLILVFALIALLLRIKRDLRPFKEEMKILSLAGSTDDDIIRYRRLWSAKWGGISALFAAIIVALNIIFINNTLLVGLEITFLQSIISVVIMMLLVVIAHISYTHHSIKSYLSQLNPSLQS